MSYRELDVRSEQIAGRLFRMGVGGGKLVGLCLERGLDVVAAMLGIFKAGGAYVPLDPTYPPQRLALLINDCRAAVIVTHTALMHCLPGGVATCCLDVEEPLPASGESQREAQAPSVDDLSYVIYTSGSTGVPKGAMIEHGALASFIRGAAGPFGIAPSDRVLQCASISFDMSVEEIFLPLAMGATVVLRGENMLESAGTFLRQCERERISMVILPTAFWNELTIGLRDHGLSLPPSMQTVIFGGERVLPERVAQWKEAVGERVRLIHHYGPTETTVAVTAADLNGLPARDGAWREVPIGWSFVTADLHVLDESRRPVARGVAGELYVGGPQLARGYLNQAELTAAKFVPDPFSNGGGDRLYRTGDLVVQLPTGELQFLDRIDQQVKIRGFRIELGEIESSLLMHPAVAQAVAIARDEGSGEKSLVACVVLKAGGVASAVDLHEFLRPRLPQHMLPAGYATLARLPLNANGKVDRRALQDASFTRPAQERGYEPPRTILQLQLADIFRELLGIERVSVRDDFFDLGGHSLLAVRLLDRIQQDCGKELGIAALLAGATIFEIAEALLRQNEDAAWSPLVEVKAGSPGVPPLFFVHGDVYGGGYYCASLARHLPAAQGFFALQPFGFNGQPAPVTIEEMAEEYLRHMRVIQPRGPYVLGGFCNGGLIAFEMARRLEARGERVGAVVLIRSSASLVGRRFLHSLVSEMGNWMRLTPALRLGVFLRIDRYLTKWRESAKMGIRKRLSLLAGKVAWGPGRLESILRRARTHEERRRLAGPAVSPERRRHNITDHLRRAMRGYRPLFYPGKLHFFWPAEERAALGSDSSAGWRGWRVRWRCG